MKFSLVTLFTFYTLIALSYAVTDENLCADQCQFCCRERMCRSESDCKGNYQPFIILGCIVGGLIGLFILRRVYVHYRNKNLIAQGIDPRSKKFVEKKKPSRWRKRGERSPGKEKERESSKSRDKKKRTTSKSKSLKSEDGQKKPQSKGDIYLEIDNESVLSAEDMKSMKNKQAGSKTDLKVTSKPTSRNEILVKSDANLDKKPINSAREKSKPTTTNKDKENKSARDKSTGKSSKENTKPGASTRGTSATKKPAGSGSMKEVGNTSQRGRSKDPNRPTSSSNGQKKMTSSTGPKGEKSRGNSAGPKKN